METDKIREAILKKAQEEADKIVQEAEAKAREMKAQAERQRDARFEEQKKKIISDARRKASRTIAQASLTARKNILQAKDDIIREVLARVREELSTNITRKEVFVHLIEETVAAFEMDDKVNLRVAPKDLEIIREIVGENGTLQEKINEIGEFNCIGGIMAETTDGMVSIDNTFDMRLDMLLPKILPEIGRKLFGSS